MPRTFFASIALFAAALLTTTAYAGYNAFSETVVYNGGTFAYAYGSLGDTFRSADGNQYIGCDVATYPSGGSSYVSCHTFSLRIMCLQIGFIEH